MKPQRTVPKYDASAFGLAWTAWGRSQSDVLDRFRESRLRTVGLRIVRK